ncbi:MAG TPA: carbon storage regulator [Bryobacteraceae bacterium]|nr:carbon storage regulator [Bryobacteraceae bacterium]
MMSRRAGETILLGDDIEIVIAHIGRSRVKVGIRAPRELPVIARELKLVREENLAAAEASPLVVSSLVARLQGAPAKSVAPASSQNSTVHR